MDHNGQYTMGWGWRTRHKLNQHHQPRNIEIQCAPLGERLTTLWEYKLVAAIQVFIFGFKLLYLICIKLTILTNNEFTQR